MIEAIIYLLLITIAEVITVFLMELSPLWGIVAHIVILILVIVHSAVETRYPQRPLLLSLALVPLVRIISLCMPLANIPQIWQYPIIYAPLLAAAVVVMRILNYRPEQVGLTSKWLPVQLAVALTGFGFGVVEYLILAPEAMVTELTWQAMWLPSLMFLVCTGFVEEFIFRGVLQRSAVEEFGGWWIVYVSLLFAILHLGHYPANPPYSYWDVLFVFVIALFFGWVVKKTGSLLGVTLSHGITNIVLYLVAPFFLG
jgi:membrane protease YdiL (CAAX protease family)